MNAGHAGTAGYATDDVAPLTLGRLRTFLYLLAIGLFAGTVAELLMEEHYDDRIQLVPFGLCALGVVALVAAWWRARPAVILMTRAVLAVIAAGSLLGVYEHVQGNLDFAREVRPHAATGELLKAVLTGGAPLLAPGILAIGALVGLAATWAAAGIVGGEVRPAVPGRRPLDPAMPGRTGERTEPERQPPTARG